MRGGFVLFLIVAVVTVIALNSLLPRLIGFGCTQGANIQFHNEEDEFPRCARIERF